jgi:hypothetical protein
MPKLKAITFDRAPKIPGIRAGDLSSFECDNPPATLRDWKIVLRGASLYFISPPGWKVGDLRPQARDAKGSIIVHEVPRDDAFLQWAAADDADVEAVLKGGKYESEPLGYKPVPVEADKPLLAQIPPGQLGDA